MRLGNPKIIQDGDDIRGTHGKIIGGGIVRLVACTVTSGVHQNESILLS